MWKSPGFLSLGVNLTHFGTKPDPPEICQKFAKNLTFKKKKIVKIEKKTIFGN